MSWDDECNAGDDIIGTLPAKANSGQSRAGVLTGIPRRLMPIECERLMGWPDGWTDVPDEKGKPASDAVRYKACGNGVVSHVPEWIARRLLAMERAA
jgi:DNA (cytosine-5)-methyltransferase 1